MYEQLSALLGLEGFIVTSVEERGVGVGKQVGVGSGGG
jgi:hypothetical protein